MKAKSKAKKSSVRVLRKKLGLNQTEFWNRVAVTQSGGSRYEAGRAIPKPVQLLLTLAYGKNIKMVTKTFSALRY